MTTKGALVYFSYSGGFVCQPEPLGVQTVTQGGATFDFLSPVRLGDGAWRPIPRFNGTTFKAEFPTITPIADLYGFAAHPAITADGVPQVALANEHADVAHLPRDTVPVMIDHTDWEAHAPTAERLLSEAFSLARVRTGQWWLGRPSEHLTGNRHIGFQISEGKIDFHSLVIACRQTRPFDGTVQLTSEIWQSVWNDVRDQNISPSYKLLLSDAVYFYVVKEFRVSLITLTSALESARDIISDRLRIEFKGTDILSHLSKVLCAKTGRNLATERPADFEFLKSAWIARGHLAHGREMFWRGPDKFGDAAAEHFFKPAYDIVEWLESL